MEENGPINQEIKKITKPRTDWIQNSLIIATAFVLIVVAYFLNQNAELQHLIIEQQDTCDIPLIVATYCQTVRDVSDILVSEGSGQPGLLDWTNTTP